MKSNKTTTKAKAVKPKKTVKAEATTETKPVKAAAKTIKGEGQVCSSCGKTATHIVFDGEVSVHTCISHITDYTTADNSVIITNVRRTV
jgi:hypothetical protein